MESRAVFFFVAQLNFSWQLATMNPSSPFRTNMLNLHVFSSIFIYIRHAYFGIMCPAFSFLGSVHVNEIYNFHRDLLN